MDRQALLRSGRPIRDRASHYAYFSAAENCVGGGGRFHHSAQRRSEIDESHRFARSGINFDAILPFLRGVVAVIKESGRLLLPGASRTAGIPFCCPAGSNRAFVLITYGREAVSYAAIARA